ncbi:MAG TPA: histidine phosphatase family protein [Actinoallomurus sp.]|jgi:probable phosphoglycerate mutase
MTQLVLVRHGETEWHAENRYAGVSDIALTARGLEQAQHLAAWARTARLAAVWTSTLTRAQLTATPCAEAIGVRPHVDERLRELDFGHAEGLTSAEMHEQFPEALQAFRADPVTDHLPGGEDPTEAVRRFTGCLFELADRYPEDRILVVAHTTAIRLALCELIGVPLRDYRRIFPSLRNCGLTEISLTRPPGGSDRQAALLEFNTPIEAVKAVRERTL